MAFADGMLAVSGEQVNAYAPQRLASATRRRSTRQAALQLARRFPDGLRMADCDALHSAERMSAVANVSGSMHFHGANLILSSRCLRARACSPRTAAC